MVEKENKKKGAAGRYVWNWAISAGRNGSEFMPESFFGAFHFEFVEFRHVSAGTEQNRQHW